MYNIVSELSNIMMQQTSYPQNYIPMNKQNFDNPSTLALKNKKDSTVHVHISYTPLHLFRSQELLFLAYGILQTYEDILYK